MLIHTPLSLSKFTSLLYFQHRSHAMSLLQCLIKHYSHMAICPSNLLGFQLEERVQKIGYALLDILGLPNKVYSLQRCHMPPSWSVLGSQGVLDVSQGLGKPFSQGQVHRSLGVQASSPSKNVAGLDCSLPIHSDQKHGWIVATTTMFSLIWGEKHESCWGSSP